MTIKPNLKAVPETMLWTLHNRAVEAMRDDAVIEDDMAVKIYRSIDYDYVKKFGEAEASHAIRSLDFDRQIRAFLAQYPDATVVNLGEGLETQRFRIQAKQVTWLSVDLPEAIAIREQFIKPDARYRHIAVSALDRSWFDFVPKNKLVFITAQGLFMYFPEQEVKLLLQDIEQAFDDWCLMFDTIPEWIAKKTLSQQGWKKTETYQTPKMPWGINRNSIVRRLNHWFTAPHDITDLGYSTFPRGFVKWLFLLFSTMPLLKNITPTIVRINSQSPQP
ncbi:Phosphoribosylamine--glycine ligase [Methylophaga frappieri]|uniref:Phosphoribosylamine--glycine ligase n=1 Tax=Methylophaga frappieri (strain ATCC BAA-2434 / DSM 25690 / JAM7) TaxID=754477 RepID=I1YH92_METFJ|nr:class I SAM-dependent methyltransferase [Methylophaga frappieri]AFJ02285.1 Phosphoribosylamine--glycine ligase [Methylophaga frappieri]